VSRETSVQISKSKIFQYRSYIPDTDTHTHTHRNDCSTWTTKMIGKGNYSRARLVEQAEYQAAPH